MVETIAQEMQWKQQVVTQMSMNNVQVRIASNKHVVKLVGQPPSSPEYKLTKN